MARACANHADREAPTACFQCRKPVCADCTTLAPHGSFCSAECGVLHRALREKPEEDPLFRKAGWALKAAAVFLGLLLFLAAVHAGSRRFEGLRRIDLLGKLFDGLDVLKKRGMQP
jgi:hypothetical protein